MKKHLSPFFYLNTTQSLGVLNDNLYKLFLIFFLIDREGAAQSDRILATAGGVFVIPFLLFSAFAGTMADRLRKRSILIGTKWCELTAILLAIAAFFFRLPWLGYSALFLMGAQSAIQGPSKYGMIPELFPAEKISKANGQLSSITYLAIISGTFLASLLTQLFNRNFQAAIFFCLFIALLGLAASYRIAKTPKAGSEQPYRINFIGEIVKTLRRSASQERMLVVILSGAYFLFVGGFVQLNIIPYAIETLALPEVGGGYLFLLTAFGIGIGSLLAGRISGDHVELGLTPIGLFGIALFLFCLSLGIPSIALTSVWLLLLGVSGGFFLIPLDSYIQTYSPERERGQNIAANNFMGFVGVLIASVSLYLFGHLLRFTAMQNFRVVAIVTVLVFLALLKSMGRNSLSLLLRRGSKSR